MPTLTISIDERTNQALEQQARSLLLGKRQFVRAILAAVAEGTGQQADLSPAAVIRHHASEG